MANKNEPAKLAKTPKGFWKDQPGKQVPGRGGVPKHGWTPFKKK